jgi:hypothetical protein
MKPRVLWLSSVLVLISCALPCISQQKENDETSKPLVTHFYKLNFVLKEMDEGKLVNQRSFTLGVAASSRASSERSSLRAGTRLPVGIGDKGYMQYVDVGTNIDAYRILEGTDGLELEISTEISSVAPESSGRADSTPIRQVRATSSVLAPVGKPTLVFTADDTVSKHRFALELTPTRER